jgi:hypothetical protein
LLTPPFLFSSDSYNGNLRRKEAAALISSTQTVRCNFVFLCCSPFANHQPSFLRRCVLGKQLNLMADSRQVAIDWVGALKEAMAEASTLAGDELILSSISLLVHSFSFSFLSLLFVCQQRNPKKPHRPTLD